ncbi:MAG: carbon monoxide dehydrogenase [Methanomassiliicoccales archaeon]|nr:carbon monoxide dehydrogenase [Methanomassiliicoccales archaeon]
MDERYASEIVTTTGELGRKEAWDHAKARIGIDRMGHRVRPGLYRIGDPDGKSVVLVTANYSLSFDALRSSVKGRNAYVLVLDTKGINVWCAAGKGTFGTEEIIKAVRAVKLDEVVEHRTLILPQLGAPGVSAKDVKEGCGFKVVYGPVRASDLPAFLDTGECTEEMRTVRFDLKDRLALAPVEVRNYRWSFILMLLAAIFVPFYGPMAAIMTLAGIFLFPALLPHLPGKDLSLKGMVLGAVLVTPFALLQLSWGTDVVTWLVVAGEYLLLVPWIGFMALNFTGSTPFASRTGVKREIFTYIPLMALMAVAGVAMAVLGAIGWGWA